MTKYEERFKDLDISDKAKKLRFLVQEVMQGVVRLKGYSLPTGFRHYSWNPWLYYDDSWYLVEGLQKIYEKVEININIKDLDIQDYIYEVTLRIPDVINETYYYAHEKVATAVTECIFRAFKERYNK